MDGEHSAWEAGAVLGDVAVWGPGGSEGVRSRDGEFEVGGGVCGAGAARVVSRAALSAGDAVQGPALVEQPDTTTLLASGEVAVVDDAGNLVVYLPG